MASKNQKRKFREKFEFVKSNYPREEKQRGSYFKKYIFNAKLSCSKTGYKISKIFFFEKYFLFSEMFTKSYGSLTNQAR